MFSSQPPEAGKPVGPVRIILPTLALVLLFVLTAVKGALPLVEERLLDSRKEMVRELVRTSLQTLAYCHDQEERGILSRPAAQRQAIDLLQGMRYGPEGKDYFWINDFGPRMVMHPYRKELVGQDVSGYTDAGGRFLFREVVRMAREEHGGYLTYLWQWKDDPRRIVPKLSYVETFPPWDWIVGTGVYIEDVHAEMKSLRLRLAALSAMFLLLVIVASGYHAWQWAGTEKKRRRAWRALTESREKFMAVLASSSNAVVVHDHLGKVMYVNPAFTRIFGWELGELAGGPIDFVPDDCREETRAAVEATLREGHLAWDTRRRRKDGRVLDVRINAATCRLGDDSTDGMVINLEDISDRKQAEIELRQSEARFRRLHEASVGAIGIHVDGRLEDVNQALARMTGYSEDELVGMDGLQLIAPEWRDMVRGHIRAGTASPYEAVGLRKDGRTYPLEIQGKDFRFGDQKARVTEFRDLSERRRAEEALRQSEEKYRLLTESITEAIWTMDLDLRFTYVSPASFHIQGWTADEIMTLSLEQVLPPAELAKASAALAETIAEGERTGDYRISRTLELALFHKNGGLVWTEVTATIMVDEKGRPNAVLGVTRDVTQRKRAEEEKIELLKKLSRSRKMEALGLLAGGVAHDLNNVLSGIVSYPDLILMDLPADSPLTDSVQTIKESGLKAAAIVQDLLTLARRGVTAFEVLNLNHIVSDVLRSPEHQKMRSYHPDVEFEVRCEEALPDMEGSPVHLKKTVLNLVANAAEAQPGGGRVVISTESRYLDRPLTGYEEMAAGEYVLLRVADRGHGIAAEDLSRIFEPFYSKKVLGRSGTGLGMAVVWGTVQDHKGYIDIKSRENQGTVFELYFPMTRKPRKDGPLPSRDALRGRNEILLVVDDIREQREIASRILSRLNYVVTTVSSGEKAVLFLREHAVDLVILDMVMDPGMDGLDTYREIRAMHPHQKVIIASGYAETERVKTALKMGVGHYLKKPYTLEKIGMAVRQALDRPDQEP